MKRLIEPPVPDKRQNSESSSIAWHPAFIEALQLELEAWRDSLEFHSEYQLTAESLRIDCVIIKKIKDVIIKKNIAALFREVNIVEYKSPDDYVSISDFYKVYGYACLYTSLEKVPVTSLTISFVESRYPRELFDHLREIRAYKVEEKQPGIYTVTGDILPIQIIDTRHLSADENLWLRDLNRLTAQEAWRLIVEASLQGKAARIGAYLDAITRANREVLQEVFRMSDIKLPALVEILEEVGIAAELEARGEVRGKEWKANDIAKNLINLGLPPETVVSATGLEIDKVKALYQEIHKGLNKNN